MAAEPRNPTADLIAAWLTRAASAAPFTRDESGGPGITEVRFATSDGDITITRPDGRTATLSRPDQPDRRVALHRRDTAELLCRGAAQAQPGRGLRRDPGPLRRRRREVTPSPRPPQVLIHRDAELLAKAVAARLVTRLVDACAARGHASLVLTGGGIGTQVLAELAAAPARDAVDWRHLDIWWGDERFLPAGDPERNETGARAALLDHVDIEPGPGAPDAAPGRARRARPGGGGRAVRATACWPPRSPRITARSPPLTC